MSRSFLVLEGKYPAPTSLQAQMGEPTSPCPTLSTHMEPILGGHCWNLGLNSSIFVFVSPATLVSLASIMVCFVVQGVIQQMYLYN